MTDPETVAGIDTIIERHRESPGPLFRSEASVLIAEIETIRTALAERDAEIERLRGAWITLSGRITAIVQNHMLGLASIERGLNDDDIALGNTREMQDGFDNCLHMVTTDYIDRLVNGHNEMAEIVNGKR